MTNLCIDQMRCAQRVFFSVETLSDYLRMRPVTEKLDEHRCIDDGHQSPRASRMMSTIFSVVRVDPALRPLLLA